MIDFLIDLSSIYLWYFEREPLFMAVEHNSDRPVYLISISTLYIIYYTNIFRETLRGYIFCFLLEIETLYVEWSNLISGKNHI